MCACGVCVKVCGTCREVRASLPAAAAGPSVCMHVHAVRLCTVRRSIGKSGQIWAVCVLVQCIWAGSVSYIGNEGATPPG
jgi:hypothetical protein